MGGVRPGAAFTNSAHQTITKGACLTTPRKIKCKCTLQHFLKKCFNLFCLSSLTSEAFLAPCQAKITLDTRRVTKNNDWGCLWILVMPCRSHSFLAATPGAGMFCLSGMQLMWHTKAGFVRAHWLAHLQLLLAGDCSEGGSQGRWLLLHVLINLEVTVQRERFWLHSAMEGLPEFNKLDGIIVFLCQLLQENEFVKAVSQLVRVPSHGHNQVMLTRKTSNFSCKNDKMHIIHVIIWQEANLLIADVDADIQYAQLSWSAVEITYCYAWQRPTCNVLKNVNVPS